MANVVVNAYHPDIISPPGETLEELLQDREMTQVELAERTGRPTKTINEIIHGKQAITPETALQFERVLGTPARFWLEREHRYREWLARQQDEANLASQVGWLNQIPLKAIASRGWIEEFDSPVEQLREVLRFFGIASPNQWAFAEATFRKSSARRSDPVTVTAWLRQGERLAQDIECAPYSSEKFRGILNSVRVLTRASFALARGELTRICASAGVAVVILPELPNTCVCGATRWLSPTKALIQLSLRYKTDDQFWFTFFHESGHVLKHGKRDAFIDEENAAIDERESEANRFAADFLIPPDALQRFVTQCGVGRISREAVKHFAEDLSISPGVVVGQLQHQKHLPYTHLNDLKQRLNGEQPSA